MVTRRACLIAALAVGCSVDDRTLVEFYTGAIPADGGRPRDGGGGAGGAAGAGHGDAAGGMWTVGSGSPGGNAGSGVVVRLDAGPGSSSVDAGAVPDTAPAGPRCPDLDGNKVLDCDETLVKNPGFARDGLEWTPEPGAAHQWNSDDGMSVPGSGSLAVRNQLMGAAEMSSIAGSGQCVQIMGGGLVAFAAQVYIKGGQGNAVAGMGAVVYASTDCTGTPLTSYTSTLVSSRDRWISTGGQASLAPQVRSVQIRLVVIKALRETAQAIHFDNVLVRRL